MLELQERMQSFIDKQVVKIFHDGRYTDEVRAVYEDFLC